MTNYICTDEEHDGHEINKVQEENHFQEFFDHNYRIDYQFIYKSWFIDCSCGTRIAGTGTIPIKEKE